MNVNYLSVFLKSGLAIILTIFLLACANELVLGTKLHPVLQDRQTETLVYECGDYSFTARIEGEHAWLFLPEETVSLPHVISASGAKYSNGETIFWNKGDGVILTLGVNSPGSKVHKNCVNNQKKAIWEHAKLNGVDFRAVGNEPGWHLEITQGEHIVLVTDYGENRYIFSTPDPETDSQARQTFYKASKGGNQLVVVIQGINCNDTMSDDVYESRVKVIINQKSYHGCGAALH